MEFNHRVLVRRLFLSSRFIGDIFFSPEEFLMPTQYFPFFFFDAGIRVANKLRRAGSEGLLAVNFTSNDIFAGNW